METRTPGSRMATKGSPACSGREIFPAGSPYSLLEKANLPKKSMSNWENEQAFTVADIVAGTCLDGVVWPVCKADRRPENKGYPNSCKQKQITP